MPNWCQNSLVVTGPKKLIKQLFEGNQFSLQKMFPCPEELMDMSSPPPKDCEEQNIQKYGHKDWYSWCVANWGTKWDPGPVEGSITTLKKRSMASFQSGFDSAWGPPTEAFANLCNKYPELDVTLEYFEPGCCFFGVASGSNGSFDDTYLEYTSGEHLQELLKECPCELAQMELDYILELDEEIKKEKEEAEAAAKKPKAKKSKTSKK